MATRVNGVNPNWAALDRDTEFLLNATGEARRASHVLARDAAVLLQDVQLVAAAMPESAENSSN